MITIILPEWLVWVVVTLWGLGAIIDLISTYYTQKLAKLKAKDNES